MGRTPIREAIKRLALEDLVTIYPRRGTFVSEINFTDLAHIADLCNKLTEAAKGAGTPDATFKLLNDILGTDPDNKAVNMELAQVYLRRNPPDYDTAADRISFVIRRQIDVGRLPAGTHLVIRK